MRDLRTDGPGTRLATAVAITGLVWGLAGCSGPPAPAAPVIGTPQARPVTGTSAAAAAASVSATPSAPASATPTTAPCSAPPVIAHRGEGGLVSSFPENTSAAELDAVRHGASVMNVDVHWTSDDVPVAIHDQTLNRTTTGSGAVSSISSAAFTALDLKRNNGTPYPGPAHPQTLAQLLQAVGGAQLPILIQMEQDPFSGGAGQASINSLVSTVSESGYGAQVVVSGWAADDLSAFHRADPTVPLAYIQESGDPSAASITATGASILYIDYVGVTKAEVSAWHQHGVTVWVWTPPYQSQWASLRAMGVDAIATNWVGAYRRWGTPCALPATLR